MTLGTEFTFSDRELADLKTVFAAFDVSGDGLLQPEEVLLALRAGNSKITMDSVHALFRQIDRDQDGAIDFDEFTQLVARTQGHKSVEEILQAVFARIAHAADDNGGNLNVLSRRDVIAAFAQIGQEAPEPHVLDLMFELATGDAGAKTVTYEQFCRVIA